MTLAFGVSQVVDNEWEASIFWPITFRHLLCIAMHRGENETAYNSGPEVCLISSNLSFTPARWINLRINLLYAGASHRIPIKQVPFLHRVGRVLSFFSSRRNWNSPTPRPQASVPPPLWFGGRGTLTGERGWESPNQGGRARTDFSLAWLEAAWYSSGSGHGPTWN
jgi:hypothetical protein